ncbi:LptF/LptG family permease [Maricaulis sp.]|uniref:LptF/LptG family permease n=1 Tax=Maricaulis sp. TaxID=1486257 RepID=UPI00261B98ED|nr:LptF/LptG family permease [Maricaulis sp.]
MISILQRYMLTQTLAGLGVATAIISSVILLVDFVEQTRDISTRVDISALELIRLTSFRAPSLIETTLPFILLFGVLTSLFRLNRQSEIVVMRGSGVSAWRILAAPMVLSVVIGLFGAMVLNPLGAAGNAVFERERDILMNVERDQDSVQPVWLREANVDGYTVIVAEDLRENQQLLIETAFLYFDVGPDGVPSMSRRIDAPTASLHDGYWDMEEAVERVPEAAATNLGRVTIPTGINRQALFERARSPDGVSFWDFPALIASAREAGLATERYELRFHSLMALPLTLLAATLIAAAATMRLHRLGGAAGFAAAGGLAGFIMFFLQELLSSVGAAGSLPPATAAWSAPAITALLALTYIASTEDG